MSNFEDWKKEYGLVYEPNYSLHTEMDCLAAFKAGQQSKQQDIESLILKWKKEAEYSEAIASEDCVSNTLNDCIEDLQKLIK